VIIEEVKIRVFWVISFMHENF
jgi:hypothetical protein